MRELTLDEMLLVTGAADANRPSTSGDFRSALIGWAVSTGMDSLIDQVDTYVKAYEQNGLAGVAAVSPAGKALTLATGFMNSLTNPDPKEPEDGSGYCADGGNYN